jgi:uncharacterized LabA/DUF88 family protein
MQGQGIVMRKTFAYIDGYNLYCGLVDPRHHKQGPNNNLYRKNSWLNIESLLNAFLPSPHELTFVKYFTAMTQNNPGKAKRQEDYLKALRSTPIIAPPIFGDIRRAGKKRSEKKTDVEIALHMYDDALKNDNYTILLLCGDSDQVPTINWIRGLNKDIDIFVLFPPYRVSKELRSFADRTFTIKERTAAGHQFPDIVEYEDGGVKYQVQRPALWS